MLITAGIYNLSFGVFAILFPSTLFGLIGMEPPKYLELWQCIGMIVGVYAVGYSELVFNRGLRSGPTLAKRAGRISRQIIWSNRYGMGGSPRQASFDIRDCQSRTT